MDKTVLGVFAIMKVVKLALSFAAITIASNYTSQIYTEKVYVRHENPPPLVNMLFLFLGIEILITVVTMTTIGLLIKNMMSASNSVDIPNIAVQFAQDYVLYLVSMVVHGSIIANIMYSKKFFLYKDDGLRAIRAYTDILTQMSMFNGLIPFNMFVNGIMDTMTKLNIKS
jgi:hypothetical protein